MNSGLNILIGLSALILITACSGDAVTVEDPGATAKSDTNINIDHDKPTFDCGYQDGIHTATLEYYNPKTRKTNLFNVEADVENCHVIDIYFNVGAGWIDEATMAPTELDDDGECLISGNSGRTYRVVLD